MQPLQSATKEQKATPQASRPEQNANTTPGIAPSPSSAIPRLQRAPATLTSNDVLHLQRSIGNRATAQLLSSMRPSSAPPAQRPQEPQGDAKAAQAETTIQRTPEASSPQQPVANIQPLAQDAPLLQRRFDEKVTPPTGHKEPSWYYLVTNQKSFGSIPYHQLDWHSWMEQIYARIDGIKHELEDDDDIAWLKGLEERTDKEAANANKQREKFDLCKPRKGKPRREARPSVKGRGYRPGKPVFTSEDISKEKKTKEFWADKLVNRTKMMVQIMAELDEAFPTSAGGFSAVGRAHKIEAKILDHMDALPRGHSQDDTFVKNIKFGSTMLSSINQVTKASLSVAETHGPLNMVGQGVLTPHLYDKNSKDKSIDAIEAKLPDVESPQTTTYNNTPVGRHRGFGQYVNMNKTNATTYAWLTDVPGWNSTRWEWLHVRAASLGGATDGTNLVVGTRDCNTQMIPFESNLKSLAVIARDKSHNYSHVEVTYAVGNVDGKAKHKVGQIGIKWKLVAAHGKTVHEPEGEAVFSPLETGRNISKIEVKHLEDTLKNERAKVND